MVHWSMLLLLSMLVVVGGCQHTAPPPLTPLELQALQTREFEATKRSVFGAVMTVFQDLGYVIESADLDTGFITAEGPTTDSGNFWTGAADTSVSETAKATAFIEERSAAVSRVRLNFIVSRETSTKEGRTSAADTPLHDAELYQSVFNRIDQALFVRKATE